MKKFLALILSCAMVLALAACGGGNNSSNGSSGGPIKVGVINNDPNESGYRTANDRAMREMFTEANGYSATFYNNNDAAQQIATAQQMIQDEVDFLLLSPASTTGWDTVLQDAQKAGTQVILFDRMLEADDSMYVAAVVSDMPAEGVTAVNWLADQGLSEYNIIHIQGHMGSDAQLGRTGALDEKVAAEASWNYVTQQTADWDEATAKTITQSVINSGKSFNVIYAENDGMARGAVAALDEAGITHGVDGDVIVMGFDCNSWALEELAAGRWNYDGQCNPFQAETIHGIIQDLQKGTSPSQKVIYTPEQGFDAKTITADDVTKYGI
ncbi:MAG: substrate-binding domain-containing protein [Oscillibacter sp.]|nr:substrate-binding domain-containing protein [Oscillibacter sp.]